MNPIHFVAPASLAFVLASVCVAAQPVQEYTREARSSRSEGLVSKRTFTPAANPRAGLLLNPAPYPNNRTDDVDRFENGRVWVSRSPVGSRPPIGELTRGTPGPAFYGVGAEGHDEVIFVATSDVRSYIAISPYQQIDERTLAEIRRFEPNLSRTSDSAEARRLLNELRAGQNQWLKEQGLIQRVRTHVSADPAASDGAATAAQPGQEITPRAVIRVQPLKPDATGKVAVAGE